MKIREKFSQWLEIEHTFENFKILMFALFLLWGIGTIIWMCSYKEIPTLNTREEYIAEQYLNYAEQREFDNCISSCEARYSPLFAPNQLD